MGRPYVRDINVISVTSFGPPLLLADNFDDTPLKWTDSEMSGTATATRDTTTVAQGTASLKLVLALASPADSGWAERQFTPPTADQFVVEYFFRPNQVPDLELYGITLNFHDGTASRFLGFSVNLNPLQPYRCASDNVWGANAPSGAPIVVAQWCYVRIAIDLTTATVSSVTVNGKPLTLTDNTLATGTVEEGQPGIARLIICDTAGGLSVGSFFDALVITED